MKRMLVLGLLLTMFTGVQAQDGCDAASINAQIVPLVTTYLSQTGTAADTESAIALAQGLQADIDAVLGPCTGEPPGAEDLAPPVETAGSVSPFSAENTFPNPVGPFANFNGECSQISITDGPPEAITENAFRVTTYLPGGEYTATVMPVNFQTFDPILFVNAESVEGGESGICSIASATVTQYVVDFSRAGIGQQVYGNQSGGSVEFVVPGGSSEVTPVDILVGGQEDSRGTGGEFVLIIEGARLTAVVPEHTYNIAITDSLIESDAPLSAIAVGVSETLNPNLRVGLYTDETTFVPLFLCEDAGEVSCQSDARGTLDGSSIAQAAVRTVRSDERDAAILLSPIQLTDQGVKEVSFVVNQADRAPSRDEYTMVFYGAIE